MEFGNDEIPTAEFLRGIDEFNAGQFFECHETLEAVWKIETSPRREFTQGVIQTSVAFYHLGRDNQAGAIKPIQASSSSTSQIRTSLLRRGCPCSGSVSQ